MFEVLYIFTYHVLITVFPKFLSIHIMITILNGFRYFKSYTENTKHPVFCWTVNSDCCVAVTAKRTNFSLRGGLSLYLSLISLSSGRIFQCVYCLYCISCAGIFLRVMEGKIDSWTWLGTKYGIASAMSHKIIIVKKVGIKFSSPADSCHVYIVCVLEMCGPIEESFPHTQHVTSPILKSSIPSHKTISPRIISTAELISHQELITWNRCLGSLKV